ncbi:MAG: AraC family transcriptional regulator [Candidatus Gastranaerophilales bacterium]|nr:AraC family transcriptional regulator [Candidatus Gastranaerophilales bacterium]
MQGSKQTIFGDREFTFAVGQYMVCSVDIPLMSRIKSATKENPCIGLVVELDSYLISQLMAEMSTVDIKYHENSTCFSGSDADEELINAFIRLAELLEQPKDKQKIFAPMIMKEIHYLLITGPLGNLIKAANTKGNQYNQIAGAINLLKDNYKEKINMEELAKSLNLAPSSFYKHFKDVTTISPLQYQKQLRLYEAQRLMLTGGHNAESASYLVGYESPTQFSREYKKMFGKPPKTDIKNLVKV